MTHVPVALQFLHHTSIVSSLVFSYQVYSCSHMSNCCAQTPTVSWIKNDSVHFGYLIYSEKAEKTTQHGFSPDGECFPVDPYRSSDGTYWVAARCVTEAGGCPGVLGSISGDCQPFHFSLITSKFTLLEQYLLLLHEWEQWLLHDILILYKPDAEIQMVDLPLLYMYKPNLSLHLFVSLLA